MRCPCCGQDVPAEKAEGLLVNGNYVIFGGEHHRTRPATALMLSMLLTGRVVTDPKDRAYGAQKVHLNRLRHLFADKAIPYKIETRKRSLDTGEGYYELVRVR